MVLREHLDQLAKSLGLMGPGDVPDYQTLLHYWNEGACLIAEQRPDLFTRAMVVKLDPGSVQELECCRTVGKVFGQSDALGNLIKPIVMGAAALADRWMGTALKCPTKGPYRVQSITRSGQAKSQFIVQPPVPTTEDVYVTINCAMSPVQSHLADLEKDVTEVDCGSIAALVQWITFRVVWDDGQGDELVTRRATTALRLFFQLINVKLKAELLYELGIVPIGKGQQLLNVGTGQVL